MTAIYKVLSGEVFKLRRTAIPWIIVLYPVLVTAIFFWFYMDKAGKLTAGDISEVSLWLPYAQNFFHFFVSFSPMLAALAAFSLVNVENKNNGWKLMYTQPVTKHYFYFSKIMLLYLLLLLSIVFGYILLLASGWTLSELYPQLNFSDIGETAKFLVPIFFKHFIVIISIATIHLLLALCWNNFIVCVGSACFMSVFGIIVMKWKYAYLFPYTNSPFIIPDLSNDTITWIPQYIWIDMLWILGIVIAGYFVVKYKQTK